MSKIKLLSENIINKIAAGEVVERPFSVVKELLENSIDAKANSIFIKIKNAGKSLIQIIDDGIGMNKEDALLALKRHSTSKLTQLEDLFNINTLGFRGEALPSISSVSLMELITCDNENGLGIKIIIESGKIKEIKEIGMSKGTIFKIENLFFNIPARLKFLKSDTTEFNHIIKLIEKYALMYFNIHFKLEHNDKVIFNLPSNKNFSDRFLALYGNEINDKVVLIKEEKPNLKITGIISKISYTKTNRDDQIFFVNKRFIKSDIIRYAISSAYKELIPSKQYPLAIIFLEINPAIIDVNVHPTKQEIKFSDTNEIYLFTKTALRKNLISLDESPEIKIPIYEKQNDYPQEQFVKEAISDYFISSQKTKQKDEKPFLQNFFPSFSFSYNVFQIKNLYIIYNEENELRIIDQHAACERILYEKLKNEYKDKKILIQNLLIPVNLEITYSKSEILKNNLNFFFKFWV
ncbi:MAG: DNA mismatch repair endonuclease MutL [bacterium]